MTPLLATPAWVARRQNLLAKKHPWLTLIQANANASGTANQRYGDFGQWAALMFAITADPSYASKAWILVQPQLTTKPLWTNPNLLRDRFVPLVLFYTWLAPTLSATDQQIYQAALIDLCDWCFTHSNQTFERGGITGHGGGWNINDTDQCLSQLLGCTLTALVGNRPDLLTRSFSPCLANQGTNGSLPLGDLTATALDGSTIRNSVGRYFAQYAAGGIVPESSQYHLNTLQNGLVGMQAIRNLLPEYLPELSTLLPDLAMALAATVEPSHKSAHCWGDCEADQEQANLFVAELFRRLSAHLSVLGVIGAVPQAAPLAQITNNILGPTLIEGLDGPDWRWALLGDPSTLNANGPANLTSHYAAGVGLLHARQGSVAIYLQAPPRHHVQHEGQWFGNYQLCRQGEWVMKSLIGYAGLASSPYAANTLAICGLGSMQEREVLWQESTDRYTYLCCRTRGAYYASDYHKPPQPFLADWTRRLLYDWDSHTLAVDDSVTLTLDPRTAPDFDRYRPADQEAMKSATALVELVLHTPVAPVFNGNLISWQTNNGAHVNLLALGATVPTSSLQEAALWPEQKNFNPKELAFQVRLVSNDLTSRLTHAVAVQAKPALSKNAAGIQLNSNLYIWNPDFSVTLRG